MAETRFFDAPDLSDPTQKHRIAYDEYGDPLSEQVVVCVHGLTRNAGDFTYLAQALAGQGCRVLAVEMAGRGRSEPLRNGADYSYLQYAADCLALMDNFHLRQVDWVGTSMGGIIGMMLAAQHPKRIRRMVLNDIGTFIPAAALQYIVDYVNESLKPFDSREAAEAQLRSNLEGFHIVKDEHWQHVFAHGLREENGQWHFTCSPHILDAMRDEHGVIPPVQAIDLSTLWEAIQIPVLVIRGEHSPLLERETVSAMRSANMQCQSVEIAGAGHAPSLFEPQDYQHVLRWFGKASLPQGLV
jgi:pimeloyl-ACP methyl ester carboxylesterase